MTMKTLLKLTITSLALACSLHAVAGETEDLKLAGEVKTAIDANAALKAFNLKITAKDGNVTIDGAVDEGLQMAEVGSIAEKVAGVKFVFNNIMPKQ